ncbi:MULTISPECIES: hypothetical protein [unclassified Diaminobutyricimonas]|uniref:hypothetical protein n=1 Tax=unclassified Diaminobutyricimonas TaxID=2643261 RepID=UPI0012F48E29|nr:MULTISPECIES: hypothetical protein [unclassified Diaminobutyricimonas]
MNIGIPRVLVLAIASLFSGYHLVLAAYSLLADYAADNVPIIVAMALYAAATALSLAPTKGKRMPRWIAAITVAVAIALPLLVTAQLDPNRDGGNGYATWYVAAVGTLMTITSTRRRHLWAWIGTIFLVAQTVIWSGLPALGALGVIGSCVWVAVSHILSRAIAKATRDSRRFAQAEREAAEWHAAQEAHLSERQIRLGQTSSMALPMLKKIAARKGELTPEERRECLNLEGAIRDEIRGRKLLNDGVREQVMAARRRGATVTLLDEGGIDDLSETELERVLDELATALRGTDADRVIVRTVPEGSDVAVTVVGLRNVDNGHASALGQESEDDEVALWLEISRVATARSEALAE